MFTIVALVYVITAGAPPEEPFSFTSKHTFLGLDKCQEYLKSPAFGAEKLSLHMTLNQIVTNKMNADLADTKPALVVTASCQEDNRL